VYAGTMLLFCWIGAGAAGESGCIVDRVCRGNLLWHGIWLGICVLDHRDRTFLWASSIPQGEWPGIAVDRDFWFTGGSDWRKAVRPVRKLHAGVRDQYGDRGGGDHRDAVCNQA